MSFETLTLLILAIAFLIAFSAFFSGSETALTAVSQARMHRLDQEGNKHAHRVVTLLEQRERLIGSILLGNNLVNILASSLATTVFLHFFGTTGVAYATLVMTLLIVVFAEVLPKTLALANPDRIALGASAPLGWFSWLFSPVTRTLSTLVTTTAGIFGVSTQRVMNSPLEEIRSAVNWSHHEGEVVKDDKDMIGGVLDLRDLSVDDVMIHRKNVAALDASLPPEKLIDQVLASPHTRLPVWRDDQDNIIGVLHAKDISRALKAGKSQPDSFDLKTIMREPWFVPETTPLLDQLRAFQKKREHFALAVDEYGALMGIITLEDILEEIVGDIKDEHDLTVEGVRVQADGSVIADGVVPIRDLNRAMDWSLPDEEAVTLAGLVIHEAQTIPEPGQQFSFYGYRFQVLRRQRNQITSLRISDQTP